MRAPHLRHLLFVLLLVLATGVAATGGAGAGTTSVRLAAASPSPYLVSRSGTSYQAVSQVTGTTFSGTLKSVVESAVQSLEQSGGGTVSFTAGDFDLGSGFFLLHQIRSITFAGQGMDTTVIHNSSDVAADTEPFNFQDTDHVLIRDLTVRAGGALRSTSDAIDFDRGNNSTVERVKITGSRAKGIIFDGKNDSWTSTGNTVRDCVIQNVPSNGIEFLASSDNLVEGCAISDVGRTGIEMGKSSTTADQPNKKSSGNTIRNNRIDNAGLNGIYVKSGDRNQILGNTITNSSDDAAGNDGIRISSADSISCDANVVDGNTAGDTQAVKTQVYGLRIGSSLCHDTTVGTNSFTGNRTGAILDLGTNTHYNAPTTDSTAPVTSIACNGGSCGGSFTGSVSVSLSASDAGSGVKATYYTVDGSDPASSATRVAYSAPFTLAASATVRFSSLDNAGNVEAAKSQAVTIGSGGGGTGGTVTLTPVADAYVSADAPAANYGTLTSLRVDGSPLVRSFVRFSVGGLGGSVTSATLRVYANSAQSPGFDVYGVASTTWSETGITYGTAPALGSKLGSSGAAAAGSWKTVDVTAAVSGNGSYSFALATTGSTALSLGSRESANKPQLIIQTSSGGATDTTAPVTSIACNGGSCGGSFTGSVSVSLSASDAGSGVKATYYTVDGSDPASSATRVAYSAPFTLAASATVRFSSLDNAGNVEAAKSQAVTIGGGGGTGGTVTLTPVADAYVSADAPAANYGTLTSLRVDGSPLVRSFVRFSVGGLGGSVTSATLRVYANSAQSPGFDVYGVASTTWSETGVTYGTAPALGSKLGSSGAAAAGSWKTVDVTAAVSGNGSYSFALATTGSTALSLGSRESANKPQLIIQTSSGGSGGTSNVTLPARAAFYYAWFPETWQANGVHVSYHPTLGYYDSSTQSVVDAHIRALDYGGVRVAIASWWGQGVHSEQTRIPLLLDRTRALGSSLKWAVYYEQEGQPTNPTVSQLQSDLAYIKAQYASSPSYAYVDGKPVIFVYNANDTTCEVADRWAQAAAGQWYVSLKVFNGFAGCTNQPASWHQYAPAVAEDVQAGYSVEISPGYRRADESAARLARDLDRWRQNVRDLVASKEPWQLVTTFNEWGEGTSVESAAEWVSTSGYGSYLDALHNDGN